MKLPKHPKIQQNDVGDLFLNFGEYGQEIELACFSSDGTKLLTVKDVGLAEIWDLSSNALLRRIKPTSPLEDSDKAPTSRPFKVFIESVALNPDGTLALLGLNDRTARLFSVESGDELTVFYEPDKQPSADWGVVRAVNFSPDGTLALVGFYGRSVGVWRVSDKTIVRLLTGLYADRLFHKPFVRDTMVSSVSATIDDRYVFAGFADMTATVWDLETGDVVFEAHDHVENILDVWSFEKQIRWATSGGSVYEKPDSNKAQKIFSAGESWEEVKFSPDGDELLARSIDGEIRKWSLNGDSKLLGNVGKLFPNEANLVFWGDNAKTFAYVHKDKNLIISNGEKQRSCERRHAISGFLLAPKCDLAVTYGWSFTISNGRRKPIELWRISTGEMLHNLISKEDIGKVFLSPCGNMIAAGTYGKGGPGANRSIYVWDAQTGEQIHELNGHTHQVHAIAFSPDSKWLVSAGLDRTVRFWNLTSEKISSPFKTNKFFRTNTLSYDDLEFHYLNILSDGRVIVYRRNSIEVWNDGHKTAFPVAFDYGMKCNITHDEKQIIGAYGNQTLLKWSLQTAGEPEMIQAGIVRPELMPSRAADAQNPVEFEPRAGAYLWRTEFGNFFHVGDGPRGWVTPFCVSTDGSIAVIPGTVQAGLLGIEPAQRYISFFPFEGRMRAGCLLEGEIRLVNSNGRVFTGQIIEE